MSDNQLTGEYYLIPSDVNYSIKFEQQGEVIFELLPDGRVEMKSDLEPTEASALMFNELLRLFDAHNDQHDKARQAGWDAAIAACVREASIPCYDTTLERIRGLTMPKEKDR